MWVTQREITEAYLKDEDILRKWHFRRSLTLGLLAIPAFIAALAFAYVVKSAVGINLFDEHLSDILGALL